MANEASPMAKKNIPNDQKVSCNVKRTKDVRLCDDLIYISCRQRNESPHIQEPSDQKMLPDERED
ncbi:hypothetical protein M408DRAFT_327252 [Serendipita vermifera MAFF 305830]|uniref:Uncharacterized protein n=1 Tax=Serendipita vermifera MAFF 305830 TaxID=933852 RepID=A0A0C2X0M5_SERVB|nr:hypothetical protein M408DRAFT_327252 [Serendipita vermifera MAFF 305830]